ncbi:hypothetical protein B5X24_HaOG202652 [Helicoverpa armigera]|uniref:Cuticle protein n=1 Tax=Helicoverpa armigera TaxID=29058 RepID=A0A2W1BSL4_HELAM|nr:hypothetical protein B5X24_HaOG202652 [Helicoverpa armigera]
MKWLLITLAIGLAAADKLDRTYLPPPGAQFSGGILGSHDAPLQPPHHLQPGLETAVTEGPLGPQTNIGINGGPVNFGDKIPKVPINYSPDKFPTTTTSYAFSQTTTYPPAEGFETTPLPINPVTGLPIQLEQGNIPFGPQGQQNIQNLPGYAINQAPTYGPTVQPAFVPGTNDQFANQPISQYPGQNIITPGGVAQIPGKEYQTYGANQGQVQYPRQGIAKQQGPQYTGAPDISQGLNQYPGQNVVYPGGLENIPGATQGLVQYPTQQTYTGQPGFTSTTAAPTNLQPSGNQYGTVINPDGSQGTYSGQPINVQNLGEIQTTQSPFRNQELLNIGSNPSYPINNQNYDVSGSTPSTIPSNYYNGVSSTTSLPEVPSSSAYPIRQVYRPERPQAAADRTAVILNYENIRTPNGYSYSFDTSNGIHADESGIVDNGTKAQGSYSYIGDDGKEYSVIYTADENGFQPRGDHLPTPPPIPEAIQKVIEQAAKDKLAGIFDDGSYDEAKYGDNKYQGPANRRRPQNQKHKGRFDNKHNKGGQKDIAVIKPIVGIVDEEYDEVIPQDQFKNNDLITDSRKSSNGKSPAGNGDVLLGSVDEYGRPGTKLDNYGIKKQGSTGRPQLSNGDIVPVDANGNTDQSNIFGMKNRQDVTNTKYPGAHVDISGKPIPGSLGDDKRQDTNLNNPGFSDGQSQYASSTATTPIVTDTNQIRTQKIKDDKTPGSERTEYSQNRNNLPQTSTSSQRNNETPSISDYINNADNGPVRNQQLTQQDNNGYYYQQPNTKFEQNTFPTRFNPQEISSTRKPDQGRNEYVQGTTRRPFITPNVYNKNENIINESPQSTTQSTSRRPFMTIRVTSPAGNSYTDYDDGQDYATDQDIGDDRIYSDKTLPQKIGTSARPSIYQSTQTSRPQFIPGDQSIRVNQKGYVTPGQRTEYSETVTPGYSYETTTPMFAQNSRFGTTQTPRRMKPQQNGSSPKVIESNFGVMRPVSTQSPSQSRPSEYEYRTSNVGSGYLTTPSTPGYNLVSTTPGVTSPQNYYSSTFRPSQEYSTTSVLPPTSEFTRYNNNQGSGPSSPTSLKPSQNDGSFNTGYHYGPPKSDQSTGLLNQISGVAPTQSNGNYQTSYQQGPGGFSSTTTAFPTTGSQGTFIPSQPGTTATTSSPYGPYQGQYQNGPSTPGYSANIISSTPGNKPVFQYPGSGTSNSQGTTGTEYGPSRQSYPSSESPSTAGTTAGSFVPSRTSAPVQDYSTTYRPGFQTTKDTFVGGPTVDGFGRPITTDQGGSNPDFSQTTQGPSTVRPIYGGTGSTSYPETYVKSTVIGEDFSGPKQQQRFDPKTGYHY